MPEHTPTAWDLLLQGDMLRQRAALDRSTVAHVAHEVGYNPSLAAKAGWLAGVFDQPHRSELGRAVLGLLTAAHLEAVAKLPPEVRTALLKRSVDERLSARTLRELAKQQAREVPTGPGDTMADLRRSARAMEVYADFDDEHLRRLVCGPNGAVIQSAAEAGKALAARIETTAA